MAWLIASALGYLLGSIPFGYVLVRTFRHEDVRATGSGNIGATNVARSGGKGLGIATLVLDTFKGWLAVVLTHSIVKYYAMPTHDAKNLAALAALAAVIGHMFPVWLAFRGGKGIATALGVFLALSWPAALAGLGVFILIVWLTRYVSLASIIAAATLPFFIALFTPYRTAFFMVCCSLISLLAIFKHRANIARLRAGTESKFGAKKVAA
jgi:glycerol-3-phosphate acyltransferase PlsY